ncbi:hypothetical protein QBC47DRAFT_416421 [Echria macrotheca]|uniref:Uncharacterized protein n=1 Tax=Echria macrotheca TaxID=438768 RepID=A0AAJ0B6Y0_9PEZI|nr:hypothetical protein QBC47DRAFT_416421 [Echria macrotheca]
MAPINPHPFYGGILGLANSSSITLPEGLSNHGDPTIVCRPADWADVASFFLINYVAHAATVVTNPGEKLPSVLFTTLLAVLFPVIGVLRGLRAIKSVAFNAKSELQKAAWAGALCTIQEEKWAHPFLTKHKVHGTYPRRGLYVFRDVQPDEKFEDDKLGDGLISRKFALNVSKRFSKRINQALSRDRTQDEESPTKVTTISYNYNVAKILISIVQTIYAVKTAYETRGNQLELYGFAAFGLTVVPYAAMSIVNLVANLFCPSFPTMYMVRQNGVSNYKDRGFDGFVATIKSPPTSKAGSSEVKRDFAFQEKGQRMSPWLWVISIGIGLLPVIAIAGYSHLKLGQSTLAQRVWIMTWLLLGVFFSPFDYFMVLLIKKHQQRVFFPKMKEEAKPFMDAMKNFTSQWDAMASTLRQYLDHTRPLTDHGEVDETLAVAGTDEEAVEKTAREAIYEYVDAVVSSLKAGVAITSQGLVDTPMAVPATSEAGVDRPAGPDPTPQTRLDSWKDLASRVKSLMDKHQNFAPELLRLMLEQEPSPTRSENQPARTAAGIYLSPAPEITIGQDNADSQPQFTLDQFTEQIEQIRNSRSTLENGFVRCQSEAFSRFDNSWTSYGIMFLYALLSVPAIGGFVVVGQMILEYGVCKRIVA